MKKPEVKIVYVDMDGVLANFRAKYIEEFNEDPDAVGNVRHWNEFVKRKCFEKLELMKGAKGGIKFLKKSNIHVKILSSTGGKHKPNDDEVSRQKQSWLDDHGIEWPAIFVPGKHNKVKYAEKGAILIDDNEGTIKDWIEAGGIGIYHTDWETTETILNLYV
jgi:5'(3')-deoxyribonucleotidase